MKEIINRPTSNSAATSRPKSCSLKLNAALTIDATVVSADAANITPSLRRKLALCLRTRNVWRGKKMSIVSAIMATEKIMSNIAHGKTETNLLFDR
jgi:hypothetical protein